MTQFYSPGEKNQKHYGQIVERAARRASISLTEIAQKARVSRRTLYNWFEKEKLSNKVIAKFEQALDYDFSKEIPNYVSTRNNRLITAEDVKGIKSFQDLKKEYIDLLEKYNTLLISNLHQEDIPGYIMQSDSLGFSPGSKALR